MNSVFMSKRLIFNESGICAFSEFLVSSSFRVSNKLQVSIFQISNKVQNGDFNDFLLFLKSQRSHFFEKRKEVGNGRKLENRKMEGCRNCVFPWRCLCSQSLGSSLVAYSVLFWTSVPLGGALHFLASVSCAPVVVALVSCVGFFPSLVRPPSLDLPRLFHLLQKSFATSSCPPCP